MSHGSRRSFGSFAPDLLDRRATRTTKRRRAERFSIARRFIFTILPEHLDEYSPRARARGRQGGHRTLLATPLLSRGVFRSAPSYIRRTEVRPFTEKQIALLQTFADQAVIAIENVRLFKELRSATQNCARRWSIRRRRPRCSASSAARRRTCSRCSTPSSRARRGFVGSMT